MSDLKQKHPDESFIVEVDFVRFSTAIISATVTAELVRGYDAAPQSILSGTPQIVGGSKVQMRVLGGVSGATYKITFEATDGQNTWVYECRLPVGKLT